MKQSLKIILLILVLIPGILKAQEIPIRPNPPKLVNDMADVLSPEQERTLESKLVAYDDSTSNQIVIVTVKTLGDNPIEEYSLKILRDWGIGNKKTNNGILILAAIDDHQLRIEVGYGLEGAVPDIVASQIIRSDIVPSFRSSDYFDGFDKATSSIIAAAAGEYKAPEGYSDRGGGKSRKIPFGTLFIVIVIIIVLISKNRGGGGGFMSRRGFGPIFFPGSGGGFGGGGWSGGGGGGGFGGFGGGSGGGGGASGSW